jgi:predicted nucleotidyltransferase
MKYDLYLQGFARIVERALERTDSLEEMSKNWYTSQIGTIEYITKDRRILTSQSFTCLENILPKNKIELLEDIRHSISELIECLEDTDEKTVLNQYASSLKKLCQELVGYKGFN